MNATTRVADSGSNDIIEAACVRLNAKAADAASITPVCTENLIRVDAVMESPKLSE
jgi:hypothetical protein